MTADAIADRLGPAGDEFYEALLEAHRGLSAEESMRLNVRLVLLLANEVGDLSALKRLIVAARSGLA